MEPDGFSEFLFNSKLVDYTKIKDSKWFRDAIKYIENADVSKMEYNESACYFMNAYNLFTINLVIEKLIKEPNWAGNISLFSKIVFFYWKKIKVGSLGNISLYALENSIIRPIIHDCRIHFAINCGSISCPPLPQALLVASTLEESLENLTRNFINIHGGVIVIKQDSNCTLHLSLIFKWYQDDFVRYLPKHLQNDLLGKNPQRNPLLAIKYFILNYLDQSQEALKIPEEIIKDLSILKVTYQNYDWHVNNKRDTVSTS